MDPVLVTGGAGYIGSHVVKQLSKRGVSVSVVDNLSAGHRWAVPADRLTVADISARETITHLVRSQQIRSLIHFAGYIVVPESVENPYKYYQNNVAKTLELLRCAVDAGVERVIFSSSAAVYGNPTRVPILETEPRLPINPYGQSKAMVESILSDFDRAHGLRFVALRYFNAAGADPDGDLGESHDPETHLIPLVLKAATGERVCAKVFGTDYPTEDGTCVRDYVHVNDLAEAHLLSLAYLEGGGSSDVFNCGYGRGYSVREVIETAKRVTGKAFRVVEEERRAQDAPELVADSTKLQRTLGWSPRHDDLEAIVRSAWEWEKRK